MDALLSAAATVFSVDVLLVILLSSLFGLFIGAIPGLTATMATALLVPVTFFMEPVPAIAAIVSATAMAIFAGDIPGALLRIPGTPASAAYTDEAYAMRLRGEADLALGVNVVASTIGGLVGTAVLVVGAPVLAEFALNFTSYEYFWLALLGLSCAVLVSRGPPVKGIVSLLLGLMMATVGIDIVMGVPRFTFGITDLMAGLSIIPVLIGVFAVTEILRKAARRETVPDLDAPSIRGMLKGVGSTLWRYKGGVARSSVLGTAIGALPGAGADIAAWIAYAIAKRVSKTPEKFGTGHVEGIVSASAANNASLSGAYVPALVFGIPGDTITAIIIGVLLMKGLTPGPMVFVANVELINAIFLVFVIANVLLLPLGLAAVRGSRLVLGVPSGVLYPLILLFCIVGAYASNNTLFDVWVMLALGVVGFVMEENDFPIAPLILALILGPLVEETYVNSMIKADGDVLEFFARPIAATLGAIAIGIWAAIVGLALWRLARRTRPAPS